MMKNEPNIKKKWWQHLWLKSILIFVGVGLIALLASMQMSGQACHFEKKLISFYEFFPINLVYFFCWGGLFFIIQRMCYFISKRLNKWFLMVLLHIGLGILFSFVHLLMFSAFIHLGVELNLVTVYETYDLSTLVYRWMNSNIYIYIALVGFLHFFYFYGRNRERELKTSKLETQMIQVQLQGLKTQLHPHFLFNALNTISGYVKKNPDIAIKMIARLSDLLRLSLDTGTHKEIPLQEELKIVNNYLEIEKLRFSDRLSVKFEIEADTRDALVPAILLQPLAENAVRHGLSRKIEKGTITISARRQNGKLELEVEDDGPGMKENQENRSNGTSLKNIRERLNILYGDESLIVIDNKENQGFKVKITLPYTGHREKDRK
ncbi:MAG: sensor protein lytS [bacterium]|nr:sensor protein lytS [bacterium]